MGAGDPALVKRIAALTTQIESPGQKTMRSWSLKLDRRRLTLQLADSVLGKDLPPIGVEADYRDCKAHEAKVIATRENLAAVTTSLAPLDRAGWRRVGIGYGLTVVAVLAVLLFVLPGEPRSGDSISAARSATTNSTHPEIKHLHMTGGRVFVAATRQALEGLAAATDEAARTGVIDPDVEDVVRSGQIFYVPNEIEVEITRSVGDYSEVQILGGESKGRNVWVSSEVIR